MKLTSEKGNQMCDICEKGSGSIATMICVNCSENMCIGCSYVHQNSRLSKTHRIMAKGDEQIEHMLQSRASYCEQHLDKHVEIYCEDCRNTICITCFMADHKAHSTQDITKMADKIRHTLRNDIASVLETCSKIKQESKKCYDVKVQLCKQNALNKEKLFEMETVINQLVERETNILVEKLNQEHDKLIKENKMNKDEIDIQLIKYESFKRYCQEVVEKAKPSEIVRLVDVIHARARELQGMTLIRAVPPPQVVFSPTGITKAVTEDVNIAEMIHNALSNQTGLNCYLIRPVMLSKLTYKFSVKR